MGPMKILLASQSPYRFELLSKIKLPFIAHPPLVDEESLKTTDLPPEDLCAFLARSKAESLKGKYPHDLIIGADQLLQTFKAKYLASPKPGKTILTNFYNSPAGPMS